MLPAPYRVERVRREMADVFTLDLGANGGPGGLAFAPGQFTMLYVFGVGEVPISISGDPTEPGKLVHTVRAVGAVTRALCDSKRGSTIGVRGPFGSSWPMQEAEGRDVVIVAGGIGLAPLRPAIYHLLANRQRFESIVILYGARTPEDLLFARELEKLRGRFDLEVRVAVDSAGPDWRGRIGSVTTLIPRATFDPGNTVAMVCGPEIMMRFTVQELATFKVDPGRIWISTERNMKCAVGFCGHCQLGPKFVCKDGPVFRHSELAPYLRIREI